ncbi:hypothetical protein RIF29_41689 [Crotalaria pallida]|uniref:Uncharacterized protein n=1 Tax=Crotalaria pallida TaxID=3830 RepID=A0AAN9E5X9_CROPI
MASRVKIMNNTLKASPTTFSQSEVEAANNLVHLCSVGSSIYEDHHSSTNNNNNNNSYSVQWKPQSSNNAISLSSRGDDDGDEIEDILADIEEDERLKRTNKSMGKITRNKPWPVSNRIAVLQSPNM